MIIDSHCHLDFDKLGKNLDNIINNAENAGVKYLLSICTNNKSFEKILSIIQKYNNVFGTYGIHPHESKDYQTLLSEQIKNKLLIDKKIIAVGESGLDFYYNHSDVITQKKCFLQHIFASQQTNKPLIVHSRNAENEIYDILSSEFKNQSFKILMHCFTGSKKFAYKLLDIGCFFSASGVITFKKNKDLVNTFKDIPNERILVETDSPYLSPEPLRGKINEPKNIIYTVKYLSKIKNETVENISSITTRNFINLFDIQI